MLLAAGGVYIGLQTLLWMLGVSPVPSIYFAYYPTYIINIGVSTILIGCSFVMLAGVLFLWHIKLAPEDVIMAPRMTKFQTYVIRRFLVFVATSIGISLFVFLLFYYWWYIMHI